MSGQYTRTNGAPQAGRDSTIPRFHMEAVHDPIGSAKAGHPVFFQQERVQIIQPGNPNSPVLLVNEEHKQRWPEHYKRFRDGEDFVADGTPLEQWPFLKKTHVLELKAQGIHTVEQCAGLSDLACQNMGMGGRAIRDNAKAYLDDAAAMSIVSDAIARADKAEQDNALLQKRLDELRPMMDQMHSELMMLKNQQPASETYVPGMHDPVQQAAQMIPQQAQPSSLDSLATARRPRGRQPAEAAA
jgi:hypothetical protein